MPFLKVNFISINAWAMHYRKDLASDSEAMIENGYTFSYVDRGLVSEQLQCTFLKLP